MWWLFKSKPKHKYVRTMMPENMYVIGKIADWQDRQKAEYLWHVGHIELGKKRVTPLKGIWARWAVRNILKKVQRKMEFVKDIQNYGLSDYWATSDEVLNTFRDDCDGFAVAMWAYLRHNAFPENNIGMVYVYGHMFACWYESGGGDDFWVLDNGFLTRSMVKASKFFPVERRGEVLEPVYGFNMRNWWKYKKIKEV